MTRDSMVAAIKAARQPLWPTHLYSIGERSCVCGFTGGAEAGMEHLDTVQAEAIADAILALLERGEG